MAKIIQFVAVPSGSQLVGSFDIQVGSQKLHFPISADDMLTIQQILATAYLQERSKIAAEIADSPVELPMLPAAADIELAATRVYDGVPF
jgi:hypothetical protein